MAITIKRSTDAGAPSLTNTAGSMITLLDYLLVTTLGWTKPYTGTNLAAYKQPAATNGFYLRVDDTSTTTTRCVGYETMSDVNTGTGAFPTSAQVSGGLWMEKSNGAGTRPWLLVSNGKIFYLGVFYNNVHWMMNAFGDFISYKAGDVFGTIILMNGSSSTATVFPSFVTGLTTTSTGHYVPRAYTQIGSSIAVGKFSDNVRLSGSGMGGGGSLYPSPIEGGLHLAPVWINEGTSAGVRGLLPGVWSPLHSKPLTTGDTFSGVGTIASRTFEALDLGNSNNQAFFETSDTWGGF